MSAKIILASQSTYRNLLLKKLNINFECFPANIKESHNPSENMADLAIRLSIEKARAVAIQQGLQGKNCLIIGSDQVASLDGTPRHKPKTHEVAVKQLMEQSGKVVSFQTGLAVLSCKNDAIVTHLDTTTVRFRQLSQQAVDRYCHAEQPYDCAGSFKSEGYGVSLLSSLETQDPNALVGLPLIGLVKILSEFGLDIP